jgi:2-polyprenyl-3-methyl-5-hydroxy-6-metoxy-1,4-benzoquinol methylase
MVNREIISLKNKYLKFTKLNKFDYQVKEIICDICNSKKKNLLSEKIKWGKNFDFMPVVSCGNCGYIFQKYKFDINFNRDFYDKTYREKIFKNSLPSKTFLKDQEFRGKMLFKFLQNNFKIPNKGRVLDVGCSVGLFLKPYSKAGWDCYGNDPDKSFINFGKKKLQVNLKDEQAEDMNFKKNLFDLTIIMGSLEHCYDVNKVMMKCYNSSKRDGILVLEARGDPQSSIKNYFNHNHYRYFSLNSLELIMLKHGFEPLLTTRYPITGPSRKGSIFCIGLKTKKKANIQSIINISKKRESLLSVHYNFKYTELLNKGKL